MAAGRCLRAQTKRFWARLEGPADVISRGIVILAACAFETFCKLVNLGDLQNPQAPLRDVFRLLADADTN